IGIETSTKIRWIVLRETPAANGMFLIIFVDTPGGKNRKVYSPFVAEVCDSQGPNYVGANSCFLVVLAPINVGTASASSTVDNVGRVKTIDSPDSLTTVFHTFGEN